MTKRDRQLQEYVAEKRVYGADGERLRLTAAERESIGAAVQILRDHDAGDCEMYDTLRGLLERTR